MDDKKLVLDLFKEHCKVQHMLKSKRLGRTRWKSLHSLLSGNPDKVDLFRKTINAFMNTYFEAKKSSILSRHKIAFVSSPYTIHHDKCRTIAHRFGLDFYYGVSIPSSVQSEHDKFIKKIASDNTLLLMLIASGFYLIRDNALKKYRARYGDSDDTEVCFLSLGIMRTHVPGELYRLVFSENNSSNTSDPSPRHEMAS